MAASERRGNMNRNRRRKISRAIRRKQVNRNYKDSLFRMIFGNRKAALKLYNAINHSNYQNPEDLEITTIEGAICMPLRGLIYFARVYQGYVEKRELDLYSGSRIKIPLPRYIVFYNGSEEEPDRREYRLSDAFEKKQDSY